ncbi:helix-turn-helix domain-containing protein [Consotaella aegiceratis]|uniref:helix-turn-helix domain-containing protein n=1 Tax=Consotaella aegiceratis TaxID=3097961 RepID=UPI002F41D5C3
MADPVDLFVGERLRELRTDRGISQQTLGEALGVTFQQLQKYEKGINRISASRLYRAAKALGVEPASFFDGFDDDWPPSSLKKSTILATPQLDDICDRRVRSAIRSLVRAINGSEDQEPLNEPDAIHS